jgi:two-component system, cell cycle response regulator
MEDLRTWYRAGLVTRLDALKSARRDLGLTFEADASVRRLAHTLRGSASTYGFAEIGEAAALAEDASTQNLSAAVEELVKAIEAVMVVQDIGDRTTVLVIDDDPSITELLALVLSGPAREVLSAGTAKEAEKILEERRVSLILLDLILPDTDGRNFLVRLKERPSTAQVPVMVLSAKLGSQPKTECFALGADAYFEKPFEVETLAAAVSSWLHRVETDRRESRRDPLTGLSNRAAFREAYQRQASLALRRAEPLAVAILDLDRFKRINDTYGHSMGDEVLRATSRVIATALRKSDLLARWGGEEFVVLFPNTDLAGSASAMRKALQALSQERFAPAGKPVFQVTFSAGITLVQPGQEVEESVAEADRLLYLAKLQGRNRIVTSSDDVQAVSESILLATPEETMVSIIKNRLNREGFVVQISSSSEQVLADAKGSAPALCILDARLPGARSGQWVTRLKSMPGWGRTPVLLLTSSEDGGSVDQDAGFGIDDYLVKPFTPMELLTRVRHLIRRG